MSFVGGDDQAEAVGADDADAGLFCDLDDLLFEASAFFADLFEAGGDDDDGFDADGGALLHNGRDGFGRHDDDDEVGGLADGAKVGVAFKAFD